MNNSPIAVGNRRLLKLAAFLEALPKHLFNYCWFCNSWNVTNLSPEKATACGTTACALGWATAIPSFRKLGLKLLRGSVVITPPDSDYQKAGAVAAAHVFHMPNDEACDMFINGKNGTTLATISKGIREYVAKRPTKGSLGAGLV